MTEDFVLAVDGGASSTRALIGTASGRVLALGRAGPSNHLQGEAGRLRLLTALRDSIGAAVKHAGVDEPRFVSAWLGMSGVWEDGQGGEAVRGVAADLIECDSIGVGGDMHTALVGASLNRPGVIVYAGTGSIAFGIDDDGTMARAGGLGYLVDDEGGAYQIGKAALRAVGRFLDGRAQATALAQVFFEHFGTDDPRMLVRAVYVGDGLSRPAMAALSRLVGDAANAGDEVAKRILQQAGHELASLAKSVIGKLPRLAKPPSVFYSGGVFQAGDPLIEPFLAAVRAAVPSAVVAAAAFPPLIGAYLLALHGAGVSPTAEVIAAITASIAHLGLT